MNKENMIKMGFMIAVIAIIALMPEFAHAQFTGGFESKMQGLTSKLITVVLPLISVLGLVYAVILALTGDGAAKGRIIMVIVCSIVGFMAPQIIGLFQSATGQ
jgi:hypothetical protein